MGLWFAQGTFLDISFLPTTLTQPVQTMKTIFATITSGLLALGLSLSAAVETGQEAPDFTLTDTHGQAHSLSDFRGQYVVLEWINHECPFVVRHYQSGNMQALQREVAEMGGIWLSINSSNVGKQGYTSADEANALTEKLDAAPAAVLFDTDGTVGRMYDARTTPHMYVITPEGVLVYQGAIDDRRSGQLMQPGEVDEINNFVRSALQAHMNGEEIDPDTTRAYGCTVKY